MKRVFKIFLIVYCILLLWGTCAFFAVGNFLYSFTLLRESDLSRESIMTYFGADMTEKPRELTWLEKRGEEQLISSEDGIKLKGVFMENPADNHKYVILCHGYTAKLSQMSGYGKRFYERGYSILAPDARAHGESGGNVRGMGYLERRDIICWIKYLTALDPKAEITLFGVSMGGATVLFTSGEGDLPSCVKAVISDCAFSNVYDEIGNVIRGYLPFMPSFPLVDSGSVVCEIRGGYSFRDASCVESVKRSRTPTLFIHGSADTFVPFYMLDEIYNAAACVKEKLVVEGAGHGGSAHTNPELYWNTVWQFLEEN